MKKANADANECLHPTSEKQQGTTWYLLLQIQFNYPLLHS